MSLISMYIMPCVTSPLVVVCLFVNLRLLFFPCFYFFPYFVLDVGLVVSVGAGAILAAACAGVDD